ncbi:hypothetical protein US8_02126 [Bacillus altitudinis]|nr:hypothetical protein US8_02126 [Bacillus altitudinis]
MLPFRFASRYTAPFSFDVALFIQYDGCQLFIGQMLPLK